MILDGKNTENGSTLDFDICIVGSGPAGITLAVELQKSGLRICILEAGDKGKCPRTRERHYDGECIGLPYDIAMSHSRCFGGTSNRWAGYCAPLDPEDFKKKPWLPHSGWPISYKDLEPYYRRAQQLMGFHPFDYSAKKWAKAEYELMDFKNQSVGTKIWHFRVVRFQKKFRRVLGRSKNIHVYLNSMMTEIHLNDAADTASRMRVVTGKNRGFDVTAKQFVLACGAIENARLLLYQRQRTGRDFTNDNIGRFFQEHPHYFESGDFWLLGKSATSKLYRRTGRYKGKKYNIRGFLQVGKELRARRHLPNAAFRVDLPPGNPAPLRQHVKGTMDRIYRRRPNDERHAQMTIMSEQFPNPDSRVMLSNTPDDFGIPRVRLNWQLTQKEIANAFESAKTVGAKLGENAFGRLHIKKWLETGAIRDLIAGGDHHMGTTRMAATPEEGVVDKNGKVFGLTNFYIAGSSVFPTSGCANPTFTILALVIRMGGHLKETFNVSAEDES